MKFVYGIALIVAAGVVYVEASCVLPKIKNGKSKCQGKGEPGTQCTFVCDDGFERVGLPRIICTGGKKSGWKNPAPKCEPICKPLPAAPKFGFKTCNGCGELGTACRFDCEIGYDLVGASTTECKRSGSAAAWNNKTPICKKTAVETCETITKAGLIIKCNPTTNVEGTVCTFECEGGFELKPESHTETKCVKKGEDFVFGKKQLGWTVEPPCCVDCSKIKKDIVILLDASTSLSLDDWGNMKNFVKNLINKFDIGRNAVRFEVVQFSNGYEVLGGKKSNYFRQDKATLQKELKTFKRSGGGTKTGFAMQYVSKYMLVNGNKGNRKEVGDMLWIFTDGNADDKSVASKTAKVLRERGVDILSLAIGDYKSFEKELAAWSGDKTGDKVLKVKNTASLTDKIVDMVSKKICDKTCE